ncbi:MAG: hypothetical protein K2J78_14545, partial [Muribaculaceae bacterium]|nr:hypothetical protein [Muribaculaceae bacterium]
TAASGSPLFPQPVILNAVINAAINTAANRFFMSPPSGPHICQPVNLVKYVLQETIFGRTKNRHSFAILVH